MAQSTNMRTDVLIIGGGGAGIAAGIEALDAGAQVVVLGLEAGDPAIKAFPFQLLQVGQAIAGLLDPFAQVVQAGSALLPLPAPAASTTTTTNIRAVR